MLRPRWDILKHRENIHSSCHRKIEHTSFSRGKFATSPVHTVTVELANVFLLVFRAKLQLASVQPGMDHPAPASPSSGTFSPKSGLAEYYLVNPGCPTLTRVLSSFIRHPVRSHSMGLGPHLHGEDPRSVRDPVQLWMVHGWDEVRSGLGVGL